MNKLFTCLLLLLSVVPVARAQSSQLSRVVDSAGNPVPGVLIRGTRRCTTSGVGSIPTTVDTFSNSNGEFSWPLPGLQGAGSFCSFTDNITWILSKPGYVMTPERFHRCLNTDSPPGFPGCQSSGPAPTSLVTAKAVTPWASVSAASFRAETFASELITASFGLTLATQTASAELALEYTIVGRRISVLDARGEVSSANLLFASPGQINFVLPPNLADGLAVIRLQDETDSTLRVSFAEIKKTVPGIFTANANGRDVPAAIIVRVKPGNIQSFEPVVQFDASLNRFVPAALDLGPEGEIVVLALFGTGWRQISALDDVRVTIGGLNVPVEYAGKQPTVIGLDQINVRLPRTLIGRGDLDVVVKVKGEAANTVRIKVK